MHRTYAEQRGKYWYKCRYEPRRDKAGAFVRDKNGRIVYALNKTSLKITSEKEAQEICDRINVDAARTANGIEPVSQPWKDFCEWFLAKRLAEKGERTYLKDKSIINNFNRLVPIIYVSEFNTPNIELFKTLRLQEGVSKETVMRDFSTLLYMGRIAYRQGLTARNLTDNVERFKKDHSHRKRALTDTEIMKLNTHPLFQPQMWKQVVACALIQGMRREEAAYFLWDDIDMENQTATVQSNEHWTGPKSGHYRTIPLLPEFIDILKTIKGKRTGAFIKDGKGKPIKPDTISRKFPGMMREAGILGATYHTLRHTCGTQLIRAGKSRDFVMHFLGHESYEMTRIYLHLEEHFQREPSENVRIIPQSA